MSDDQNHIESLLSALKDGFLHELPDRCEGIEDNILLLENASSYTNAFDEVFRAIHSLKGSGGTYGLPIITTIAHQFEDLLSDIDQKKISIDGDIIDVLLKYNDLLKNTSAELVAHKHDPDKTNHILAELRETCRPETISCMLVEKSSMLTRACKKELSGLPISLTTVDNGLVALERLLQEKFNLLITSKELPVLNGVALISAIRNSDGENANIPCIITTSKENLQIPLDTSLISIIRKDKNFSKNLASNVSELFK